MKEEKWKDEETFRRSKQAEEARAWYYYNGLPEAIKKLKDFARFLEEECQELLEEDLYIDTERLIDALDELLEVEDL